MPPRRSIRGRGRGAFQNRNFEENGKVEMQQLQSNSMGEGNDAQNDASSEAQNETPATIAESEIKTEAEIEVESENVSQTETTNGNPESGIKQDTTTEDAIDYPYKVKVSHLPAVYSFAELLNYLWSTFNMKVPKIMPPVKNSPWLLFYFETKEQQENCIISLHNHIWKKKALRAIAFYGTVGQKHPSEGEDEGPEGKKVKFDDFLPLSLEEEILSESLPLYNVPYEEQNRLTIQDVQLLSNKLHAFMCVRNPALAGWAEMMKELNDGCLFKIEPLKPSPLLKGYRNRCKFRIGKNTEGETTVGFCLNDNENKILGVQPGDKLIHLPDSMKYAAKKFEDFIRASGIEPYNKKQKSGYWHHIVIRIAPEGKLMMVVVTYHNHASMESFAEIKEKVRDFFVNGDGKDCNLCSLYFQIMSEKAPMLSLDKLELLLGESHFYENICGLKFYVGPFSILNVNSSSSENVYKSIAHLADPTPETVVLDLCSGTGGIAFTIADKCKKVIAIESQEDHINDALKTKEINNIQNVEFIKGKVEDELANVFEQIGDAPVIPIIDPPRQGLVQKAISQLRARESIEKLVYVCSNSKMGAKNFLDLCASADKKEGTFGNPLNVMFAGLPFLPVRAIPVDVCPHTVNNTIIILFERIDPSTFPPPQKPPPQPLKRPQSKLNDKRRRRNPRGRMRGGPAMGRDNRRFRMSFQGDQGKPFKKGSNQGGGRRGFHQGKAPPPLLRSADPAMSLVAKYERRIAELEQQDRAFKAGLTMGLQALGSRGGPGAAGMNFDNFGTNFGPNLNENMPNYRNSILGNNPAWQRGGGGRNFDNPNFGGGGNNFSGGFMGGGFNFNSGNNFGNFGGGIGGPSGGSFISGGFRSGGPGLGRGKGDGGGGYRNFRGNKRRRQA